jgi:hypothetical protein
MGGVFDGEMLWLYRVDPDISPIGLSCRERPHREQTTLATKNGLSLTPSTDRVQVADIPISHPSASKQHAVIQYRQVVEKSEFGDTKTRIK